MRRKVGNLTVFLVPFATLYWTITVWICIGNVLAVSAQVMERFNADGEHHYFYLQGNVSSLSNCSAAETTAWNHSFGNVIGELWRSPAKLQASRAVGIWGSQVTYTGTLAPSGEFKLQAHPSTTDGKPLEYEIDGTLREDGTVASGHWSEYVWLGGCLLQYTVTKGWVDLPAKRDGEGYLKITGSTPHKDLSILDLGDKFWVEFKPPKGSTLEGVREVKVSLHTDDASYGTRNPIAVTLARADGSSDVFRGPAGGILATHFVGAPAANKIVTIYGDTLHVEQTDLRYYASARVKDYTWDDGADKLRFALSATTPGTVEIAPDKADHIGVELQNSLKQPVPGATISWQIPDLKATVSSVTNTLGISELYFSLLPTGDYMLWVNGTPAPNVTVPPGSHAFNAKVSDADFGNLVDGGAQKLIVKLLPRITITFLNSARGGTIHKLLPGDAFNLEVHGLPSSGPTPKKIEVALRSTTDSKSMTLYRYPSELDSSTHYLSEASVETTAYMLVTAGQSLIEVRPGSVLTATYQGTSVSIPMYGSWVQDELAQIRRTLDFFDKLLAVENQAALSPDQAARVQARLKLIANANAFLNSDDLLDPTKMYVGAAYLNLLGSDPTPYIPSEAVPQPITTPGGKTVFQAFPFGTSREAEKVFDAIAEGQNFKLSELNSLPSQIGTATYNGVKNIPSIVGGMITGVVTAPIYGAYTLGTGLTLNGERASTFELVMGGVDVVLGAATVLSVAYPRMSGFIQATGQNRMLARLQGLNEFNIPGFTEAEMLRINGGFNSRALFEQALRTPAFMDIPGAIEALKDLASGTANKIIGSAFAIRCILEELAGGEVRLVEDLLSSKQAADVIRRNGDVVQYKSYSKRSLSKLWADMMEQGESDVRRYAANGWKDRLGGKLSGSFEWHFDAKKLLDGGVPQAKIDLFAEEASKWLTYRLNGANIGQYGTPSGSITFKVVARY
jgi:hypothetical protein